MDEVKLLIDQIRNRNFSPVYLFTGEESYYIDRLSQFLEKEVLTEAEKDFNQTVLYGRDVDVSQIISHCKRFPMMSEYQLVIVKEAQELAKTIDALSAYTDQPQPSTILVLCYKYKKLDKRKKLYKSINKTGVVFESKKLYENQVPDWIRSVLASKKYTIEIKAAQMLVEFLGNDLGRIHQELEKLQIVIPSEQQITPELIEQHIGISKDFNNFELRKAIGEGDVVKAHRIIHYFSQNPKQNPLVMSLSLIFSFFTQLMQYHGLQDHSPKHVAQVLGINPYFVTEYKAAAHRYPMKRISQIIATVRNFDLKSKGVGANNLPQSDLLRQLLVEIM